MTGGFDMKPKDIAKSKIYHPPCLRDFGDLKKITLGSSGPAVDVAGKSMPNPGTP
jgi:hypothetical protein